MLNKVVVVTTKLGSKGLIYSPLGVTTKMNLNMGEAQAGLGGGEGRKSW